RRMPPRARPGGPPRSPGGAERTSPRRRLAADHLLLVEDGAASASALPSAAAPGGVPRLLATLAVVLEEPLAPADANPAPARLPCHLLRGWLRGHDVAATDEEETVGGRMRLGVGRRHARREPHRPRALPPGLLDRRRVDAGRVEDQHDVEGTGDVGEATPGAQSRDHRPVGADREDVEALVLQELDDGAAAPPGPRLRAEHGDAARGAEEPLDLDLVPRETLHRPSEPEDRAHAPGIPEARRRLPVHLLHPRAGLVHALEQPLEEVVER